jgi:hypothetical protein
MTRHKEVGLTKERLIMVIVVVVIIVIIIIIINYYGAGPLRPVPLDLKDALHIFFLLCFGLPRLRRALG